MKKSFKNTKHQRQWNFAYVHSCDDVFCYVDADQLKEA